MLERSNAQNHPMAAGAENRYGGLEQRVDVQGVHVLRRALVPGERQVIFQDSPDVVGTGVVWSYDNRARFSGPARGSGLTRS